MGAWGKLATPFPLDIVKSRATLELLYDVSNTSNTEESDGDLVSPGPCSVSHVIDANHLFSSESALSHGHWFDKPDASHLTAQDH